MVRPISISSFSRSTNTTTLYNTHKELVGYFGGGEPCGYKLGHSEGWVWERCVPLALVYPLKKHNSTLLNITCTITGTKPQLVRLQGKRSVSYICHMYMLSFMSMIICLIPTFEGRKEAWKGRKMLLTIQGTCIQLFLTFLEHTQVLRVSLSCSSPSCFWCRAHT